MGKQYAATWRNAHSQVVETTDAATMCWAPRKAGYLRIKSVDGFIHVIRCRTCSGCLEFDRRRLEKRLLERYRNHVGDLFLASIKAPIEQHARLAHNLHRRPGLELEPGLFRLGTDRFGVLARSSEQLDQALKALGLPHTIWRIRKANRRRPWSRVSAGLLVARENYGEQTKRWYARGLPPAEKLSWAVERITYQKGYDWRSSTCGNGNRNAAVRFTSSAALVWSLTNWQVLH